MYTKVERQEKKKESWTKKVSDNFKYMQITYDLNFVKYIVYASIICVLFFIVIMALGYKMPFVDPLSGTKGAFLTVQIGCSVFAIVMIMTLACLIKTKDSMLKAFLAFATLLLIAVLTQGWFLVDIIKNADEKKFGEYYETYENSEWLDQTGRRRLSLSTQGITDSTAKNDYIQTSKSSFRYFVLRASMLIALELIIFGFSLYVLYKLVNTQAKLEPVKTKATA